MNEDDEEEPKQPTLPAKVIIQIDKMVEEKVREIYPIKEYKPLEQRLWEAKHGDNLDS